MNSRGRTIGSSTVPFSPDLVGQKPVNVVLGKNSGPPSIQEWCEKLGITANDGRYW